MESEQQIREDLAIAQERYERALANAESYATQRLTQDIDGGLGEVVVNGYGLLQEVNVNQDGLPYANGRSLGAAIVKAVNQAERRAAELRASK